MRKRAAIGFLCFLSGFFVSGASEIRWWNKQPRGGEYGLVGERIRKVLIVLGPDQAVKYFRNRFGANDPGTRHELEHLFGNELYRQKGLGGIVWCGDESAYGCYHGFLAAAIAAEGDRLMMNLPAVCKSVGSNVRYTTCLHGVGHGLLAHNGYGRSSLKAALDSCGAFAVKTDQQGCQRGVFMEYFTQTMSGEARIFMPVRPDAPDLPCRETEPVYKESCYAELPSWWFLHSSDHGTLGAWCGMVSDITHRLLCFEGAGQLFAGASGFDISRVRGMCQEMPDAVGVEACTYSAARQFAAIGRAEQADALCAALPEQAKKMCQRGMN